MIRRPPRSTLSSSSAASDVYKRQVLMLIMVLFATTVVAEEEECPWAETKVEPTSKVDNSPLKLFLFWFILIYLLLFFIFGLICRGQHTEGSLMYVAPQDRVRGLCGFRGSGAGFRLPKPLFARKIPVVDTFRDIGWSAALIVLAMLWSSFFEAAFAVIYWKFQADPGPEVEECPERIGTYACAYAGEVEDSEWAIVIPALVCSMLVVASLLFGMSKVFGKYWVEFATGICGHMIGFRWLDGVIMKLYGDITFKDIFTQNGMSGASSFVAHSEVKDQSAGEHNWNRLWNTTSADWTKMIEQGTVTLGETTQLASSFVGNLNASWNTQMKDLAESLEHSGVIEESKIGGLIAGGENPETEYPWCFFVEYRDRFVCYVDAAFQEVVPFFWASDDTYGRELGHRATRMLAFGLLSIALLFTLRGIHEFFLTKMFMAKEGMSEQEITQLEVDEEEYDEAIEDVVNDAAGNATGWLLAHFISWVVVGLVTKLSPYHNNLQYGTTQPLTLLVLVWVLSNFLNWVFSTIEVWNNHREAACNDIVLKKELEKAEHHLSTAMVLDPPDYDLIERRQRQLAKAKLRCEKDVKGKFEKFLDKYSKGYLGTVTAWMLGYLVYTLLELTAFLTSHSQAELDRLRCSTGFTAFTPNYPGKLQMEDIFAMTPFSKFGVACMVLAVFLTKLAFAHYDMDVRETKKILMSEMHDLVCANRKLKRKVNLFKHLEHIEESVAEDLEAKYVANMAASPRGMNSEETLDRALLALRRTHQMHLETVVNTLIEDEEKLREHQKLCKHRVSANTFMEEFRRNEKDYFAVTIGLAFEAVIDAVTEWQANCQGLGCSDKSPLAQAKRMLLADFVAALAFMIFFIISLIVLGKLGFGEAEDEEEEVEEDTHEEVQDGEHVIRVPVSPKRARTHTTQFGTKMFLAVPVQEDDHSEDPTEDTMHIHLQANKGLPHQIHVSKIKPGAQWFPEGIAHPKEELNPVAEVGDNYTPLL
eukprot:TRINITY_DN2799_c0_g1_i1.p1 TRINITY_DN2799_c0_g1~~TRINITY_DN2799_c0_g1_i1.p1  ORF type:complete len:986 (+),score=277.36 TRINITY_DN2799_c0_g1_i1:93-3050(+)